MKDILLLLVATGLPFALGGGADRGREFVPMERPIIVTPVPGRPQESDPALQPETQSGEDVAGLDLSDAETDPDPMVAAPSPGIAQGNAPSALPEDAPDTAMASEDDPAVGDAADAEATYPEFVAGFRDCLFYLTRDAAELRPGGAVVGQGASFTIFYPVMKQPFDFVVSITETASGKACSGQGPLSVPYADIVAGIDVLAAVFAEFGMAELAFPGAQKAFADCERAVAMLLTEADGLTVFAGFTGTNAVSYCTSFGRKE